MSEDDSVNGPGAGGGDTTDITTPIDDDFMSIEFVEHTDSPEKTSAAQEAVRPAVAAPRPITQPEQAQQQAADEEMVNEIEDKLLRARAEFENYRKRVERDRDEQKKSAARGLIQDLLPVMDNMDLALQHVPQGCEEHWAKGVAIVLQQFHAAMEKAGLQKIEAAGAVFDPAIHEAIATVCDETLPHNQVVDVSQNGYTLWGKLLKPAKVRVNFTKKSNGGPDA